MKNTSTKIHGFRDWRNHRNSISGDSARGGCSDVRGELGSGPRTERRLGWQHRPHRCAADAEAGWAVEGVGIGQSAYSTGFDLFCLPAQKSSRNGVTPVTAAHNVLSDAPIISELIGKIFRSCQTEFFQNCRRDPHGKHRERSSTPCCFRSAF